MRQASPSSTAWYFCSYMIFSNQLTRNVKSNQIKFRLNIIHSTQYWSRAVPDHNCSHTWFRWAWMVSIEKINDTIYCQFRNSATAIWTRSFRLPTSIPNCTYHCKGIVLSNAVSIPKQGIVLNWVVKIIILKWWLCFYIHVKYVDPIFHL